MEEAAVVAEEDAVEAAVGGVAGPGLKLLLLCGGGGPWLLLLRVSSAKRGPWTGGLMGEYRVIRSSGSKQGVQSKSRDVKYRFFFSRLHTVLALRKAHRLLIPLARRYFRVQVRHFIALSLSQSRQRGRETLFALFVFVQTKASFLSGEFTVWPGQPEICVYGSDMQNQIDHNFNKIWIRRHF